MGRWRWVVSRYPPRTHIAPAFLASIGKRSSMTLSIYWTVKAPAISPPLSPSRSSAAAALSSCGGVSCRPKEEMRRTRHAADPRRSTNRDGPQRHDVRIRAGWGRAGYPRAVKDARRRAAFGRNHDHRRDFAGGRRSRLPLLYYPRERPAAGNGRVEGHRSGTARRVGGTRSRVGRSPQAGAAVTEAAVFLYW